MGSSPNDREADVNPQRSMELPGWMNPQFTYELVWDAGRGEWTVKPF